VQRRHSFHRRPGLEADVVGAAVTSSPFLRNDMRELKETNTTKRKEKLVHDMRNKEKIMEIELKNRKHLGS